MKEETSKETDGEHSEAEVDQERPRQDNQRRRKKWPAMQPPWRGPARIGIKYAHVFWKPPFAVFQWKDRGRSHIPVGYKMK